MIEIQRQIIVRAKVAVKWAELFGMTEEAAPEIIKALACFSHTEFCKPFILADLRCGVARSIIRDRYAITDYQLRRIGVEAGIYKPRRF